MHISTEESTEQCEIVLEGRFDAHESDAVNELITTKLAEGQTTFAVDLAAVVFLDSTALAVLTSGMKRARQIGGDLVLVSPSDPVRVILELTRLDHAFVIR